MQLIVKLTNFCNLKCTYCSEGDFTAPNVINKELLFKLVDDLDELLQYVHDDNVEFLWHGGEPLTYLKDDLCEVMDYAIKKLGVKYAVKFLMQTNLTLLDDNWLTIIKKYKIGIGVSLDGYPALHNANRITVDNKPTFHLVYENIKKLKSCDIIPGILMVLNTEEDIDINQLFDVIEDLDVPCKIHPVVPCGRAGKRKDTNLISSNYVKLLKNIYTKMFEENRFLTIEPLTNMVDAILGRADIRECSFAGSCGKSFLCIFADGGVGFCGRKSNDYNLKYGDLKTDSLLKLYNSANAIRIRSRQKFLLENDCKNCNDFDLCHGGCAYEATVANGAPETKYPNCETRKEIIWFLKTEGLNILKQYLIKEKRKHLASLREKKKILEELSNRERQ